MDKSTAVADDDAAEGAAHLDQPKGGERGKKKEKSRGQNTNRKFGASRDEVGLCASRANSPEFSPSECRFGEGCKFEHDLRKYLKDWKREDLTTFGGVCPIWYVYFSPYSIYILLDLNSIVMHEENMAVMKLRPIHTGFRLGKS